MVLQDKTYGQLLPEFRDRLSHLTDDELRYFQNWHDRYHTVQMAFTFAYELELRRIERARDGSATLGEKLFFGAACMAIVALVVWLGGWA